MIASLMMYQRPQLAQAHSRFWALIRKHLSLAGIDSPQYLSQSAEEFSVWLDPNLVLSQTCGMPYRSWLHTEVSLVGTPDYGVQGCSPGYYRSAMVVRIDEGRSSILEFANAVFAYNQPYSQSGYAASYWHLKSQGFWFENKLQTGQHIASAKAVCDGQADIASIDAISWRLIEQHESFAKQLKVLEWTVPTPGLPLITSLANDSEAVLNAVSSAIGELSEADRSDLCLRGIVRLPKAAYLAVENPELPECKGSLPG